MQQLRERRTNAHPAVPPPHHRRHVPSWVRILLSGLVLWMATVVITFATGNPNLVPTIILLGSFVILSRSWCTRSAARMRC